jgi:hypothetical protein
MIDDGFPYKVIIEKLGDAGKHLTEHNLTSWRQGGYQDHVKAQAINERARAQTEAAAEMLHDAGTLDPQKVQQLCAEIALLQYVDTLIEHGDQIASQALQKNPAKMITLINACCNMSNTEIALEKRQLKRLEAPV